MNSNPVVWFEIYVADMPRAKVFYESVLGVPIEKLPMPDMPDMADMADMADEDSGGPDSGIEMMAFPMHQDGAGAAGALVKMPGYPMNGNGTIVYFTCDDCAVEAGRVADAGGTLERPKMSIGEFGFIALATDPDGNMFGLHSEK